MMDNPFVEELNLPKESLHLWIPLESNTSITSYLLGLVDLSLVTRLLQLGLVTSPSIIGIPHH
jgi:hypothetical protein